MMASSSMFLTSSRLGRRPLCLGAPGIRISRIQALKQQKDKTGIRLPEKPHLGKRPSVRDGFFNEEDFRDMRLLIRSMCPSTVPTHAEDHEKLGGRLLAENLK